MAPKKKQKRKNRRDSASAGSKPGNLTNRRKLFIELVPVYMNYSRAAREAGFSAKAAHTEGARLMAVPEIRAAVEKRIAERASTLKLTAENVILKLEHNYYGAVEDRDWNAANVAAKDQGKHIGMFKEKVQIDFTTSFAQLVTGSMLPEPVSPEYSSDTSPVDERPVGEVLDDAPAAQPNEDAPPETAGEAASDYQGAPPGSDRGAPPTEET